MKVATLNLKKLRWFPLCAFIAYMVVTFLFALAGPINYPSVSWGKVALYVGLSLVFFFVGYRSRVMPKPAGRSDSRLEKRLQHLMLLGVGLKSILVIIAIAMAMSSGRVMVEKLVSNPGEVYREAHEVKDADETSVIGQLEVLIAPLWYLALPLGFHYYRKLSFTGRALYVCSIGLSIFKAFGVTGTQKPIGDVVMVLSGVLILHAVLAGVRLKKIIKTGALVALIFTVFVMWNQDSRLTAYDANNLPETDLIYLDTTHPLIESLPPRLGLLVAIVISYPSVGYAGLSHCFGLPFEWTYGIGSSFALSSYADQYLGIEAILNNTYPLRAQDDTGWPSMMLWETIYPWLASDMTYPGVLLFCYFLGRFYATVWLESILFRNPLSIIAFCYANIMLLFFPSNNQLFQTRESTFAVLVLLVVWAMYHNKLNNEGSLGNDLFFRQRAKLPEPLVGVHGEAVKK